MELSLSIRYSIIISLILTFIVMIVATWIFRKGKKVYSFWDLARDSAGWPSLARFQFLIWTLVVLFSFTTVSLIRLLSGVLEIPSKIPENLLILMGISVAVTPISAYVSTQKYGETILVELTEEEIQEEKKKKRWGGMLLENYRPSLTRFQMFSWTILGVILYLTLLFSSLGKLDSTTIQELFLPDVDYTLVMLMGLSQGAYVGGKFIAPMKMDIIGIHPKPVKKGETATITGVNFGVEKGTVTVGPSIIADGDITKWDDNKIAFKVPLLEPGKYDVTVLLGTKEVTRKIEIDEKKPQA